jgi:DUF1680 family protein
MPVRRVYAHANVKDDQGKVALMRGPLVYCIEAADHPGANPTRLSLPADAELLATHRAGLLGGVTVITGMAMDADKKPVPLTAIPYYTWQNREKGAMTVWIQQP